MSPSCSATKTRAKVSRPKKRERPRDHQVEASSERLGRKLPLTKSSRTIAAREFIPDDTVLWGEK